MSSFTESSIRVCIPMRRSTTISAPHLRRAMLPVAATSSPITSRRRFPFQIAKLPSCANARRISGWKMMKSPIGSQVRIQFSRNVITSR